jgi:hypothetical protein
VQLEELERKEKEAKAMIEARAAKESQGTGK